MSREIFFNGVFEPVEARILQSILREGMRFVDVGANRGYFTILAGGLVGRSGQVLALEPDPRMYGLLTRAVAKSHLHQVRALPIAAAARAETVALSGFDEATGNFGVSKVARHAGSLGPSYSVTAQPLDGVLAEHGYEEVDLLKMDIEGYEGFALAGLTETLIDNRIHRMLVEFHPEELATHGHDAVHLIRQLIAYGYTGWQIDHSGGAYRKSAYGCKRFRDFVRPLTDGADLSRWPHIFWVRRGLKWSPDCL